MYKYSRTIKTEISFVFSGTWALRKLYKTILFPVKNLLVVLELLINIVVPLFLHFEV